jgi:hypothetical protein
VAKDKHELDSMTKDDLVAYADSIDAEVQHSWLKDEIVSAIMRSQRAAAKQKQPASKEVTMNDTTETEVPEVAPVKVTGPINIKGQNYVAGDEVMLTEEETAHLTELGAPIEGVEPLDEEAVQAKHDEGVEAQNTVVEERAKASAEQEARDEAYEAGEEFDEAKFSAEYDRQKKLANPDYEAPAAAPKS